MAWILFIAMSVVWGIPYLLIKVAVRDIGPAELVFIRTALGALLLLPIALYRKELRASLRPWLPLLAYTVVEIGVPWLLLSHAEQRVDSSLTGLVIAGVPLVAALIARERLSGTRVAGLLTGLAGVGLLVGFHGGTGGAIPILELLGVVLCYATGPLIIERWLADVPRYGVSAASLIAGALLFAPVAVPNLPSLARTVHPGPALAAAAPRRHLHRAGVRAVLRLQSWWTHDLVAERLDLVGQLDRRTLAALRHAELGE